MTFATMHLSSGSISTLRLADRPRRFKAWILPLALLCAPGAWAAGPWPSADFQRGVVYSSWDGSYPAEAAWPAHFAHFESLGVQWLELMTFAHQPEVDAPTIKFGRRTWPTKFIAAARKRGFKILLKPHVFSRQFYDGSKRWRGSIVMKTPEAWAEWFRQYETFILAEAKQAAAAGVEMFSVGLEYVEATRGKDAQWRALIAKVRKVYPGVLTYSADYNHERDHIGFWDVLDVIGINIYLKLSDQESPGLLALKTGILPHFTRLAALSAKFNKPIIFPEVGFPSVSTAAIAPWQWPSGKETVDAELQARAYETVLSACSAASWCQGMYWWKYYEKSENNSHAHDYSPRGKPAEKVLRRWYRAKVAGDVNK